MRRNRGAGPTGESRQSTLIDQPKESLPGQPLTESPSPSTQAVAVVDRQDSRVPVVQRSPTDILLEAIQNPALDIAKLERLMQLQKDWAAEEARKAFARAMVVFKKNPPKIVKNRTANVTTKSGGAAYSYEYADLPAVLEGAVPALAAVGIQHSWDMQVDPASKWIKVTCILTHEDGHSVKVEGGGPFDDSGGKNPTQTIASANSYWQRYTFNAACGLSSSREEDDDGHYAGDVGLQPISGDQLSEVKKLIKEAIEKAGMEEENFLEYMKVGKVEEIPIQAYELAISTLKNRLRLRGG